jgi:hypothetical protein
MVFAVSVYMARFVRMMLHKKYLSFFSSFLHVTKSFKALMCVLLEATTLTLIPAEQCSVRMVTTLFFVERENFSFEQILTHVVS